MALKHEELNDYNIGEEGISFLLYGRPGSGKTTLTASAQKHPALANLAYISSDKGLISITQQFSNIVNITFDGVKDLLKLPAYIVSVLKANNIHTVVIDSLTSLNNERLSELNGESDKIDFRNYGYSATNIEKIIHDLRSAGINVIMTAGEKDEYDTIDGKQVFKRRRPDMPPSLNNRAEYIADFIWNLFQAPDGSFNMVYQPQLVTGSVAPMDIKTRGAKFSAELDKLKKAGQQKIIQIGQVGSDPFDANKKYSDLSTFYDLLLKVQTKEVA